MTQEERIAIEHRLTSTDNRARSNTRRLDELEETVKKNSELVTAIEKLAMETKYMREDLNKTISRIEVLEQKDVKKWDKFKWLIVSGIVTIVLGYLAIAVGLK